MVLFCSSSLVYIKLLILWSLVLLADYFLEFRFEYLWPFWLFLRSVYDSFKYQGLVSSNDPCFTYLDQTNFGSCRHSQYSSFALPSRPTWFAFCSSRFIGCSSPPAPTSGSSMFGTQVIIRLLEQFVQVIVLHTHFLIFYRKRFLRTNSIPVASFCLHWSFNSAERVQSPPGPEASSFSPGSLSTICRPLHWVSCGDTRFWFQILRWLSNEAAKTKRGAEGERVLLRVSPGGTATGTGERWSLQR